MWIDLPSLRSVVTEAESGGSATQSARVGTPAVRWMLVSKAGRPSPWAVRVGVRLRFEPLAEASQPLPDWAGSVRVLALSSQESKDCGAGRRHKGSVYGTRDRMVEQFARLRMRVLPRFSLE